MFKVFASGAEQEALPHVTTWWSAIRRSSSSTSDAAADELVAGQLVEDITDQYAIPLGGDACSRASTCRSRVSRHAGTTASHPDYKGARRLSPGPHHYLVQFVGPVKPEWLDAVQRCGGEVVDTYAGFTVIVRADDTQIKQIAQLPVVRWAGHLPDGRTGLVSRIRTNRRCRGPSCCEAP